MFFFIIVFFFSDAHRLTINEVTIDDSGVYGCHAGNAYSTDSSTVDIKIEGWLFMKPRLLNISIIRLNLSFSAMVAPKPAKEWILMLFLGLKSCLILIVN